MFAFVSTSRSSSLSTTIQTTTRERKKRVLSSAFATCSRSNYSLAKRREEAFKPRSSSSSSSRTATTSEEHNKNTMTPIQLQDVARKHFENRERTRAQMVERRLEEFRSGNFEPPNREKTPFNKPTPHFFSSGVILSTPPSSFLEQFERLETC